MALFTLVSDHRGDPMNITSAHTGMIIRGGVLATALAGCTTTVLQLDSTVGMKAGDTIIAQTSAQTATPTQDASGKTITSVDGPHQITLSGALSGAPPAGAAVCDSSVTGGAGCFLRAVKGIFSTATGTNSAVLKDPVSGRILWADDDNAASSGATAAVTYSTVLEQVNTYAKNGILVAAAVNVQLLVWLGIEEQA